MGADQHPEWRAAAASLAEWWVEAGLDTLVDDSPRDWLAAPAPTRTAPAELATGAALPRDWASFMAWRQGADAPEAKWPGAWVTGSGAEQADVMVLADCPDRDDAQGGALLGGAAGRLFDRMLAAIGLSREHIHLAAVCAKRPTAGRLPPEATERLAAIARHHVAMVGPKVLLLLGDATSRAVLATDARQARGRLHSLNHGERQVAGDQHRTTRVIVSHHPRFLLDRPGCKAEAWADLRLLRKALEQ